jgi:putative DNA primase/helicase
MQTEQSIAESVRKRVEELPPDQDQVELDDSFVKKCLDANERGDGVLFATIHKHDFLFNSSAKEGEWYVWNEHVWRLDEKKRSINAVERCALEYQRISDYLKNEIAEKAITKSHDDSWKINLFKKYNSRVDRLRTQNGAAKVLHWVPVVAPEMSCREDEFDKQPWLLPVRNGVINLKTGALESGRQEDLLTRSLDIDYNPHACYGPWQDIVDEICDDFEIADFLQRSLGYAMTGFSNEQFIWVFIGPGRNGKGVLFSMLADVLGPYYHELTPGMIIEQRSEPTLGAASEHKYSLLGKRLVVGAETNRGQRIDARAVKNLTGDDMINCRPNFRSEINFRPSHSLFLHTNNLPYGLTKEFSLLQRLLLIRFPYMYVDNIERESKKEPAHAGYFRKKDPKLKEKLKSCREGILRWLVEGCLEWQHRGLDPPQSILDNIDLLSKEEDVIGNFVEQCMRKYADEKSRISCSVMYDAFRWWWNANMDGTDRRRPSMKTINTTLRDRGFRVEQAGGRTWIYQHYINLEIMDEVTSFGSWSSHAV